MSTAQALGSHRRACMQAKEQNMSLTCNPQEPSSSLSVSSTGSSMPPPSLPLIPMIPSSQPQISQPQSSQPQSSHPTSSHPQSSQSQTSQSQTSQPGSSQLQTSSEAVGQDLACCGKTYKNKSAFLSHTRSKKHQEILSSSQSSSQSSTQSSSQSSLALQISSSSTETSLPSNTSQPKYQVRGIIINF